MKNSFNDISKKEENIKAIYKKGTNKINAAIIRQPWFKNTPFYKDILDKTNFLDGNPTFRERFYCYKNNISELPINPRTGKKVNWIVSENRYEKIVWNRAKNMGEILKKSTIKLYDKIFDIVKSKEFIPYTIDEIKIFIKNKISETDYGRIKNFITKKDLKNNAHILASIYHYTKKFNFEHNDWSPRLYLIYYDLLNNPPKAKDNPDVLPVYKNFIKGFGVYSKNYDSKREIEKFIEKNFDILEKKDDIYKTMTLRCHKCGFITTLTLCNGKWKKYVCQNCSSDKAKFKKAIEDRSYNIEDINVIQNKIKQSILSSDFGRKTNFVLPSTYKDINFLASVIELTSYIPVENNFRWAERFYLVHHNLYNNPPEATNAKGELPHFLGFLKGYQSTKAVPKDKIKEEYSKLIKEELTSLGFDVISIFQNKYNHYCAELKCNKCKKQYITNLTGGRWKNYKCSYCYENIIKSTGEEEIINYLKSIYDDEIIVRSRDVISPRELDIFIPELKLAIEFNGLFWHTEENGKDKNYHLNKTILCAEKGIQLIHIFEDEWNNKQQIVKARLKHLIKKTPYKIFARKCIIKEIDNFTATRFINKYHLQGNSTASVRLGLFYKNHLVSVMTFCKSRFNKKYDWELARFASVFNFSIIGGASKLLTYFRNHYQGSIISYADKRWSEGNLYKQLGFKELQDSPPGYFYTKGKVRYSRIKFQKHKLKDVLKNFDPNISEAENMRNNGYHRIWDCGNKVFEI